MNSAITIGLPNKIGMILKENRPEVVRPLDKGFRTNREIPRQIGRYEVITIDVPTSRFSE